ncbi:MAG: DUF58 domain-containing protein [Clostridiales bacterium]|nr:DUF58 domain-containing protein [Clostridiales bacterium]
MEAKQNRTSRLASLPGLCLLLFFAIVANYFQAWLISAFLLLIFLFCLGAYVWSRGVCRRVAVSVEAPCSSCHAGERGLLKLTVRNRSFFPLVWLDVIVPTGQKPLLRPAGAAEVSWFLLHGEEKRQTGIRERFVWLLWQQEIAWEEEYQAMKRGVVPIDGISLAAGDGFGLSVREEWYPLSRPLRLFIYPRLVPVQAERLMRANQEAAARSQGHTEDPTILKGSRPYQAGDPMKKINWRLLAASGQMITNVYETVQPGCAAFLLDLESFRRIEEKEEGGTKIVTRYVREQSLERMISLIASCICALNERRVRTALVIPAYGAHEAVLCLPREDSDGIQESLEALALIDYRAEDMAFPYEEFWRSSHKLGNIYLCARTDGKSALEPLLEELGRGRSGIVALSREQDGGEYNCLYWEDITPKPKPEQEEVYERIS